MSTSQVKSSFSISSILASSSPRSTIESRAPQGKQMDEATTQGYGWNRVLGMYSDRCPVYNQTICTSPDMTPPQSPTETSIDGSSQYLNPRVYYQHHVPSHQFHHRAPCTPGSSPDRSSTSNIPSPLRTPADQGFSPPDVECPRVRSNRMSYSKNQVRCLEAVFLSSPYPESQAFEILAEELGLPEKKLKIWFQNKRARSKRRQSDQCRSPMPTVHHHPYLLPAASMLPTAFPPYQYMMPGVMMTQQGLMLTPTPEMQMMQHSVFSFPTSGSPTMASAHAQFSP